MGDTNPVAGQSQTVRSGLATGIQMDAWKRSATVLALCGAFLIAVHWETIVSIVSIWNRSETFTHGFLILPISLYLLWQRRRELLLLAPRPDYRGMLALGVLGAGWLLSYSVDVLVFQQFFFVSMFSALVWAILGWEVLKTAAFPLGFLLFGVPVGEALIPPMMNFTAAFAVKSIQLTGIPVYWEGLFLTLPNGNWSIVEGCSGVRYLIASVTLGFLYAYLSYRTLWRRALFVALSFIVPVIANGFRAYLIIMIGYWSNMRLATGVDHLIYGWVFFGLVMLVLFWIGSFWREKGDEPEVENSRQCREPDETGPVVKRRFAAAGVAAAAAVALWPAWSVYASMRAEAMDHPVVLSLPDEVGPWRRANEPVTTWRPRYLGMGSELEVTYENQDGRVSLYVPYYRVQSQGKELVNSQNVLIRQKHPVWNEKQSRARTILLGEDSLQVTEATLTSEEQNLLVWKWYWVGGRHTSNPYRAKMLEAMAKLVGGASDGAAVIVYGEYKLNSGEVEDLLMRFVDDMLPVLEKELASASALP